MMITFQDATSRLMAGGVTLQELADELDVSLQLIKQARMDPSAASSRRPPAGWAKAVARLARERSGELAELASQLEGEGKR
jgi:hypothetical protein